LDVRSYDGSTVKKVNKNNNGTDGQTDRQSATQYAAPPREEGRIIRVVSCLIKEVWEILLRKITKILRSEVIYWRKIRTSCIISRYFGTDIPWISNRELGKVLRRICRLIIQTIICPTL